MTLAPAMTRSDMMVTKACGLAILAAILVVLVPGILPNHSGWGYIGASFLMSLAMLWAWHFQGDNRGRQRQVLMTGLSVLFLCSLAGSYTSHDMDRYLWDGAVLMAGFDPYSITPDDPLVSHLRLVWPTPPEHAQYPTLYPPFGLGFFALITLAGPEWAPVVLQALILVASITLLFVARHALDREGVARHLPLIAFSPILIFESGVGAHIDTLATMMIILMLLAARLGHFGWAGLALGVAALIKLWPALLGLPMLIALGVNRNGLRFTGVAAGSFLLTYALTLMAGYDAVGSLPDYLQKWRFGAPVYAGLNSLFGELARPFSLGLLAAAICISAQVARRDLYKGLLVAAFGFVLTSAALFPWYLMIAAALIAFRPGALGVGFLILHPLTYEVINGFNSAGSWDPAAWPLWITGGWLGITGLAMVWKGRTLVAFMPDWALPHDAKKQL